MSEKGRRRRTSSPSIRTAAARSPAGQAPDLERRSPAAARRCSSAIDEVAFVAALLDDLAGESPTIDRRAHLRDRHLERRHDGVPVVACELADRFAAIAGRRRRDDRRSTTAGRRGRCSVLVIHGSADRNLPYDGGVGVAALAPHTRAQRRFGGRLLAPARPLRGEGATHDASAPHVDALSARACAPAAARSSSSRSRAAATRGPEVSAVARASSTSFARRSTRPSEIWAFFARH